MSENKSEANKDFEDFEENLLLLQKIVNELENQDLSLSESSRVSNSKLRSSISILGISLFKMVSGRPESSIFRLRSSVSNCVTRLSGLIFEK